MGDLEISKDFTNKIEQIKINLKSWTLPEWIFFFVIIPAFLLLIYALPQNIRDSYFILNTTSSWNVQTLFLFSYTHSQLYPHLAGNVASYLLALMVVFSFENNRQRFWIMAAGSLLLVPVVSSLLTIGLFHVLGVGVNSQGFSAIGAAFIAYAMISIVIWILGDMLEEFDHPEYFRSRPLFIVMCSLLTVVLALIIVGGIDLGLFLNSGDSTSNGIAHFGGFITLLIVFLLYDVRTEKRKYFQMTFGMAVGMGIIWYGHYLFTLVRVVKGL